MTGFKNSFKILCIFILKKCNTAWKPQLLNINHVRPLHMLNNSAEWRVINSLLRASAGRRSLICPQRSTATSQALTSTWLYNTTLHFILHLFRANLARALSEACAHRTRFSAGPELLQGKREGRVPTCPPAGSWHLAGTSHLAPGHPRFRLFTGCDRGAVRSLGKSEQKQVTARGIPASHSQPVPGRAQQQPALVSHGRGRNVLEKLGIYC